VTTRLGSLGLAAYLFAGCAAPVATSAERPATEEARGGSTPVFLVVDTGGPLVVVSSEPEIDWGIGPVELVPQSPGAGVDQYVVTRWAIDPRALPERFAGLAGRHVVLHGSLGERCYAELGELELVGRAYATPWNSEPLPDGELPASSWQDHGGVVVLAARARPLDEACAGSGWASLADQPEPRLFVEDEPDEASGRAALDAVREFPDYWEIADLYAGNATVDPVERAGRWEHHGGGQPSLVSFQAGERRLIGVDLRASVDRGGFMGSLWALYELHGALLELRARGVHEPFPERVIDAGDELYLLGHERLTFGPPDADGSIDARVPFRACDL
jgi:hypothetical protein